MILSICKWGLVSTLVENHFNQGTHSFNFFKWTNLIKMESGKQIVSLALKKITNNL